MVTVVLTYKRNPSVSREDFREWWLAVDVPAARELASIHGHELYEVIGGQGPDTPYDLIELIDIQSQEAWEEVGEAQEMQKVMKEFPTLADMESVAVAYAEKVETRLV